MSGGEYRLGMTDRVLPRASRHMGSWEQLTRQTSRGGVVVIFDDPTDKQRGGARFHHVSCDDVAEVNFERKRSNRWSTGAYYWAPDAASARLVL